MFLSKETITENIIKIISGKRNPIILFREGKKYYNIITSDKKYIINKETNSIEENGNFVSFSSPYFLCANSINSINYYLFANKKYYSISLNSQFKIENINYIKTLPDNVEYSGYIQATKFDGCLLSLCRCDVNQIYIFISFQYQNLIQKKLVVGLEVKFLANY